MELNELVDYLDGYLRIADVPDYPGALNGLQVEADGPVGKLAVAVDASERTIRGAIEAAADLLVVHHGLFWGGNVPVTGRRYRRLRLLLESGTAVYGAHLPLDVHPEVGNNVVLAGELGVKLTGRFAKFEGTEIGYTGELDMDRGGLRDRLSEVVGGPVKLMAGGPERVRRVGVVTGGGGSMIGSAIEAGLDALITGEGAHHTYFDAVEGGLNVYYAGHYATETWGVRALARHLEEQFGLAWAFIDAPTGL